MSGLNSVAAGNNNHTSANIPATTYEFHEGRLRRSRTYHNNITSLRQRVQKMNDNLTALPDTLTLMKTIERKKADHEASVQKEIEVEDKETQLEQEYAQS
ncbi:hypothetical protein KCU73_g4745, partial [Aureobasidium melanogenum]